MQVTVAPTQLTAQVAPVRMTARVGASGDVLGPGSSTDGRVAVFEGVSGRRLRETATGAVGLSLLAMATLTAGSLLLGNGACAPTELATTAYGRSLLGLADASAGRSALGLGSLAVLSSITASQISDSTTTGRAVLTAVDAAAGRSALGLGSLAVLSSITASQISDSTATGRAVLTAVDAAAGRSALGLGSLAVLSSITASQISDSTATGRSLLTAADVAAARSALGLATSDSPTFAALTTTGSVTVAGLATIDSGSGAHGLSTAGVGIFLSAANSTGTGVKTATFGSAAGTTISAWNIGGTRASQSATLDSSSFFQFIARGHDGSASTGSQASYGILSDGLWSGSNRGAYHSWRGTPSGSTAEAEWMRLYRGILYVYGAVPGTPAAGQVLIGGGQVKAAGGATFGGIVSATHSTTGDNSAYFANTHSTGYGPAFRGGGSGAGYYCALFQKYDGTEAARIDGNGALVVGGGIGAGGAGNFGSYVRSDSVLASAANVSPGSGAFTSAISIGREGSSGGWIQSYGSSGVEDLRIQPLGGALVVGGGIGVGGAGYFGGNVVLSGSLFLSSASPYQYMDRSASGSSSGVVFRDASASPTRKSWFVGVQNNVDDGWELTPSTTNGGTTFSTPVLRIPSTGLATFYSTTPPGTPGSNQVLIGAGALKTAGAITSADDFVGASTSGYYFGDRLTDGTWRLRRDGSDLVLEHRQSGSYVEASRWVPPV